MKFFTTGVLLIVCFAAVARCKESEDSELNPDGSWWARFKQRVKTVLFKWRDDIKDLWDDVLGKAEDMRGWTKDMFESFKSKMKEWLETRPEVNEDDRNDIENFISKLKMPTERPEKEISP